MRRWIRGLVWLIAAAGAGLLAASWGGAVHPAGDSLAVLRWQMAAALALVAAILGALGARRSVWLLGPVAVAVGQTGWAWFQPQPQPQPAAALVLYQKNLMFRLTDTAPLAADIRAAAPDVLTLQELASANRAILPALSGVLPTQHICPFARVGAVALASRWPEVPGSRLCLESAGVAALQVVTDRGRLWIVSIHLHWPWPHAQAAQLDAVLPRLSALSGPMVIGGDFNMVPWGASLRRLAEVTGTRRVGRALNSFPALGRLLPLPIDHVFASAGAEGRVDLRPRFGSDHRGILARIDLWDPI